MAQLTVSQSSAHGHSDHTAHNNNLKFAMWLYLGSEIVIFSILIAGYVIFRVTNPEAVNVVKDGLGILLVTANTFILLASSYAMVMGLRAITVGDRQGFYRFIGLTAILGAVFLGGQYIEYSELAHLQIALQSDATTATSELFEGVEATEQLVTQTGNFGMRFYAPTAFHGFHVLVGVLWALFVLWQGSKGRYDGATGNPIGVEIFGLYWHFVDVVWIVLFTLIYLV